VEALAVLQQLAGHVLEPVAAAVAARVGQRLSSSVRELRCEVAEGQIPPDDYVMGETSVVVVAA